MYLITCDKVSVIDISKIYVINYEKNIQKIFELKERDFHIFFLIHNILLKNKNDLWKVGNILPSSKIYHR